jgi:hypothetical protein
VTHDGTTQSVTSNVANIAANTVYKLRIRKIGGTVYFSVDDGTEVSTSTNVPASGTAGYPIHYFSSFSGTKQMNFARCSCQYGAPN